MNTPQHIPEDDLALFALALMEPDEAAATAAHLEHCDVCRGELARLQGDLAVFAITAEMQDPPAAARARLLSAVAKEKKSSSPFLAAEPASAHKRERHDQRSGRGMSLFGWFGWAVAAGLTAFSVLQVHQLDNLRGQANAAVAALERAHRSEPDKARIARAQEVLQTLTDPSAMQVALHLPLAPGAAPKPEGHAAYVARKGELVFVATHLRPIQPGKTYELWLLPASGQAPVPAGLFRPDENGNASVVLPVMPKNIAAKGFGVTVEDAGGANAPTPPIVLAGTQG